MARLTARALVNYQSVNSFQNASQWTVRAGDDIVLYFQLIDLEQGAFSTLSAPVFGAPVTPVSGSTGLRYIAGVGSDNQPFTMTVTFPSIDTPLVIAAIPDANDASIFKVTVPAGQTPAGGNVIFKLVEGQSTKNFSVLNMIAVEYPGNDGSDGSLANSGC